MSKYQPKIFINNPEKDVPNDIVEQFFLSIKTGDLDKIRNFVIQNKNKYNLIEKGTKENPSGRTPIHVVLELDDKIADEDTKLSIIKFLDKMGAPLDYPDTSNVWPIHLAASKQYETIVDYLVKKQVSVNRKDSSNNTPLHYAVNGKEIRCPKSSSIRDLVPEQKIDKLPFNRSLENINKKLINLLSSNDKINKNIMHMINTIMKIPEMYSESKMNNDIQSEIINIFVETAISPTFPAAVPVDTNTTIIPNPQGMTGQQIRIEQLINQYYSNINDELLKGLTNAMDIAPNNGGWGPSMPTDEFGGTMPPNNLQKIMKNTTNDIMKEVDNEYATLRNNIITNSTVTDTIVRVNIPLIVKNIDSIFIDPLVFCPECTSTGNGEVVTLTKMFFLMSYGLEKVSYEFNFSFKIMNNFKLFNKELHDQVMDNPYVLRGKKSKRSHWNKAPSPGVLFNNNINSMINDNVFDPIRTDIDIALAEVSRIYTQPPTVLPLNVNCINDQLRILFTNSDEIPITNIPITTYPHDEYSNGYLGILSFKELFTHLEYGEYVPLFYKLRKEYKNTNWTWFDMLDNLIEEIGPIPEPSDSLLDLIYYEIVNGIRNANPGISDDELVKRAMNTFRNFLNDKKNLREYMRRLLRIPAVPITEQQSAMNFIANDIFGSALITDTNLPQTPFARSSDSTRRGGLDSYTYDEIFRVLNAIQNYLVNGDFQIRQYPSIFDHNINSWEDYVDTIANLPLGIEIPNLIVKPTIGERYPEFIFLYKVFITRVEEDIKNIIRKCTNEILEKVSADTASTEPSIISLRNFIQPLDDAHALYMLLPSEPDPSEFTITNNDPLADLKARKWKNYEKIMKAFAYIKSEYIPDELWNNIVNPIQFFPISNYFTYDKLPQLRQLIEESVPSLQKLIEPIVNNYNFRNTVRQYLGTYISNDKKNPSFSINVGGVDVRVPNRNIISRYRIVTKKINFFDVSSQILSKLRETPNNITDVFYLTELYGNVFATTQQHFLELQQKINIINKIISDIISFINNEAYYYIPQIFLPALIKQIIVVVRYMFSIKDYMNIFVEKHSTSISLINLSNNYISGIVDLGNNFTTFVNNELDTIYKKLVDIIKYHNDVVDFLNFTSSYHLMKSNNNPPLRDPEYQTTNIFTMNLIPLETLPNIFTDIPNFESLISVMKMYRIPNTEYYGQITNGIHFEAFGISGNPAIGFPYIFDNYRNIIEYRRSIITNGDKVSNSPLPGDNSQLNITAINQAGMGPVYDVHPINTNYNGEWLDMQFNGPEDKSNPYDPSVIKFSEAFIAYIDTNYIFDWLNGMPPSIKKSIGPHLKRIKQKVIEETIQFIINNKYINANQDPDLVKLYEDIRRLGNESTYTKIDDVKIYVVIGKLLDSIINRLLEYSVRQSISSWILSFVTTNYKYRSLVDVVNKNIDIIREKDYLRLTLNEIDVDVINKLLNLESSLIDTTLTQIEPNLDNIKYISKPINKKFVHYLYDINYFSSTENTNRKCYNINPNIVSKLVTSTTINLKNSDGNTPLHMAVNMTNPELVNLLILKGANPKGYNNLQGKTPQDLGLFNVKQHAEFTYGAKVYDTISNFVEPFNDMLISRIKDERYGNNIIKNISTAIPIQLIIYNHMFHLFLENYRYNFTIEMKNKIRILIKKYLNIEDNIYPLDLLTISDKNELEEIIKPEITQYRTASIINEKNQRKIDYHRKELDEIKNELNGYTKEISTLVDPNQIESINKIRTDLQNKIIAIEAKITNLKTVSNSKNNDIMSVYMSAYQSTVNSIPDRINRTMELVEFYNFSFARVGKTKQLYLNIWENYLNKKLSNAPSMIFSLLNNILLQLVTKSKQKLLDSETKEELRTITDFYDIVRRYIVSKNPNNNIDDDPLLLEEVNQIIYLINLIITPAVRNILLSHIYSGLKEMDGANTIIRDQTLVLNEILDVEFNGQTLDSFLTNILPMSAIKYYAMIYENSYDVERRNISDMDLFMPIIQIIKSNKVIMLTDESLLIQNIREYLIPFLSNTYQNFIHYLRLTVYGYERYLLNTWQLTKIMEQLV
jgi:ankyrin repeat protein